MNMPKIGDHIIVRKANGFMPLTLKHTIQTVQSISENHRCYEEGSGDTTFYSTAVVFTPGLADHSYYTSAWHIVPKIGDRVRATAGLADTNYYGTVCTVTEVIPNEVGIIIRGEFPSLQKPDDTILLGFSEWEPADEPVRPSQETALIGEMRDEITSLKERISVHMRTIADWEQDWSTLTQALHNEADRRGWCNEYDEFVNEVASDLRIGTMPVRERDYEVTWTTSVLVSVEMSRTVTAANEEDAEEMVKNDYYGSCPETQDVVNAVEQGNWEQTDDYTEYEVNEA